MRQHDLLLRACVREKSVSVRFGFRQATPSLPSSMSRYDPSFPGSPLSYAGQFCKKCPRLSWLIVTRKSVRLQLRSLN